ncbi:hypothetical protein ACNO8X_19510 [Mycobacterium sp. PDNC021]|uniref:hypothetical protein n=1 Tax=Mycobacterium sp. PDNC021 TaxID=3391399 RepID=UPI003AAE160D
MTEPTTTAQDLLRADILASGRDDFVSMADVRGRINRRKLVTTDSERQQLMVATIRSLLEDGLVEVGDIPGPNDPGFLVWPGEIDAIMVELTKRIVDQWGDPDLWEYSTWLNLTAAGQSAG